MAPSKRRLLSALAGACVTSLVLACNGIIGLSDYTRGECSGGGLCEDAGDFDVVVVDAPNGAPADAKVDASGTKPVRWAQFKMPNYAQDGGPGQNVPTYKATAGGFQDTVSKLVWGEPIPEKGGKSYEEALKICAAITTGGSWRLPSRNRARDPPQSRSCGARRSTSPRSRARRGCSTGRRRRSAPTSAACESTGPSTFRAAASDSRTSARDRRECDASRINDASSPDPPRRPRRRRRGAPRVGGRAHQRPGSAVRELRLGNKVITDRFTKLAWDRPSDPYPAKMTFAAAKAYCQGLAGPMRLPSLKELLTLVDEEPHSDTTRSRRPTSHATSISARSRRRPPRSSGPRRCRAQTKAWTVDFGNGTTGSANIVSDTAPRALRRVPRAVHDGLTESAPRARSSASRD